jgi:hypothetical protein
MNASHTCGLGIPARQEKATGRPARFEIRLAQAAGRARRFVLSIVVATFIAALSSSTGSAADGSSIARQPLTQQTRSGPVELSVTLDRAAAQIAEPLTLTLTASAPAGVSITLPRDQTKLGSLNVLQISDQPDVPTDNGRQWTRQYRLESLTAGKQMIPAISVAFVDGRQANSSSQVVSSRPLELTVTSVLEGTPDPLKFRDIKDVVDLPADIQSSPAWIAWSFAGASLLAVAGVALLVWPTRDRQLSPDQWAVTELERLEREGLIETGQTQLFYFQLTDIVRQYIEQRFDIAAPKLTTAEFLDQVTRHDALGQSQQGLLRAFLSAADLVKFACFEPTADDARQGIATARHLIEQSAEEKV